MVLVDGYDREPSQVLTVNPDLTDFTSLATSKCW